MAMPGSEVLMPQEEPEMELDRTGDVLDSLFDFDGAASPTQTQLGNGHSLAGPLKMPFRMSQSFSSAAFDRGRAIFGTSEEVRRTRVHGQAS